MDYQSGIDYHQQINRTAQFFAPKSGKTLPPVSAISHQTQNVRLNEFFGKTQNLSNIFDEEQQQFEIPLRNTFQDRDLDRTKFLVDKLSGKFNIDPRYLNNARSSLHFEEEERLYQLSLK